MHPRRRERDAFELFQAHFDQLLNPKHELVQLAGKIDWDRFEAAFAGCYASDMGAPGKASRLTDAYVDKGYRCHGYAGSTTVHVAGQRNARAS